MNNGKVRDIHYKAFIPAHIGGGSLCQREQLPITSSNSTSQRPRDEMNFLIMANTSEAYSMNLSRIDELINSQCDNCGLCIITGHKCV